MQITSIGKESGRKVMDLYSAVTKELLAVHPEFQGRGLGKSLLRFAEEYAVGRGYSSIRLDVYTQNPAAVRMYERAGYEPIGVVRFPFRLAPYLCFEKILPTLLEVSSAPFFQ